MRPDLLPPSTPKTRLRPTTWPLPQVCIFTTRRFHIFPRERQWHDPATCVGFRLATHAGCYHTPYVVVLLTLPSGMGRRSVMRAERCVLHALSASAFLFLLTGFTVQPQVTTARVARSSAQWSAWEFGLLANSPPSREVKFFQARVSVEPSLRQAIVAADLRAAAADNYEGEHDAGEYYDEWEDEDEASVLSRPSSPLSRPPSPLAQLRSPSLWRCSKPLSDPPPTAPSSPSPNGVSETQPTGRTYKQAHRAAGKKARRSRHSATAAQNSGSRFGPLPKARHSQGYREEAPLRTKINAANLPSSSAGNWTGSRPPKRRRLSRNQIRRLQALLDEGNDLVEWDGRCVRLYSIASSDDPCPATPSSSWTPTVESWQFSWVVPRAMTGTKSSERWSECSTEFGSGA